jgi:hypothetical protein
MYVSLQALPIHDDHPCNPVIPSISRRIYGDAGVADSQEIQRKYNAELALDLMNGLAATGARGIPKI